MLVHLHRPPDKALSHSKLQHAGGQDETQHAEIDAVQVCMCRLKLLGIMQAHACADWQHAQDHSVPCSLAKARDSAQTHASAEMWSLLGQGQLTWRVLAIRKEMKG